MFQVFYRTCIWPLLLLSPFHKVVIWLILSRGKDESRKWGMNLDCKYQVLYACQGFVESEIETLTGAVTWAESCLK